MTTKPNIIFLDIDSVLCAPRSCLAVGNEGQHSYLDPIACLLVRKLCEECNAKLVISSAWRLDYDFYAMQAILNANCPNLGNYMLIGSCWRTVANVYSIDDDGSMSSRGKEINEWLKGNEGEYNNFVIIDDIADMRPLQKYLVKCDVYDGMGYTQYHAAERILMQGYSIND